MTARKQVSQKGFSLIELMMTIAVLAILVGVALPAIDAYAKKRRIIGAAEELYSQLQFARSEAIKQSVNMYVKFALTGASPSTTWDLGVSSTSGCDPVAGGAANCLVSGAEKVFRSTNFPNIRMTTPTFLSTEANFNSTRGTVNAGQIDLSTTGNPLPNYSLRVDVSVLGRIRIISTDGSVSGYPTI